MTMVYENAANTIIQRLTFAHDPKKAVIRGKFLEKEYEFLAKNIQNKNVFVAGSGLGHDSFELAKNNLSVLGVELLEPLVRIADENKKKAGIFNITFRQGDFTDVCLCIKSDVAVLTMGTIGDFGDKAKVIRKLLEISPVVYLDFYPPTKKGLSVRTKMYKEEGWKNIRIENRTVVSDDGLWSASISKKEMDLIVKSIGAQAKYHRICSFSIMAEIKKSGVAEI